MENEKYSGKESWEHVIVKLPELEELRAQFARLAPQEELANYIRARFLDEAGNSFTAQQLSGVISMRLRDYIRDSDLNESERLRVLHFLPSVVDALVGDAGDPSIKRRIVEDVSDDIDG